MEVDQDQSPVDRPTVSFSVGLALLVIMLLGITAFFFCCLYWDRLRSFLYGSSDISPSPSDHEKPLRPDHQMGKQVDEAAKSVTTVLMPGDDVPKFIAMVCPCEPPLPERISVVVHKSNFHH